MNAAKQIAVVHLVWQPLPIEYLARFLDTYRRHAAGVPHELVIVVSFPAGANLSEESRKQFLKLCTDTMRGLPHRMCAIRDGGLDLDTYGRCLKELHYTHFCFLNSYSEIQADGWLAKLDAALVEGIGAAGATGSFEESPTRLTFFPNPHLRTNGFLISSDIMWQVWPHAISNKDEAYEFESGTQSLTRRIQALGLRLVIVGRNGTIYEQLDWPVSETFRQRDQQNLLIADNHSALYANAHAAERLRLCLASWGGAGISK